MNELNIATVSSQVEKAVAGDGHSGQLAAKFTSSLFSKAGESSADELPPERLAKIALNAFSFFEERKAHERKLRIYDFEDASEAGPVTVIEAVNDDMPFLLSSVLAEMMSRGFNARFVAHPIFRVHRDAAGKLTGLATSESAPANMGRAESFLHIEIDPLTDADIRDDLIRSLGMVFDQARAAVSDWMAMLSRMREVIDSYVNMPPPVAVDELAESVQFLKWLADGHFTFLGAREYAFSMRDGDPHLETKPETALGLLRDPDLHVLRRTGTDVEMSPIAQEFFSTPALLIITKANFHLAGAAPRACRLHRHQALFGGRRADRRAAHCRPVLRSGLQ